MEQFNRILFLMGTVVAVATMYFTRDTDYWLPTSFAVFLLSHIRYELANANIRENGK